MKKICLVINKPAREIRIMKKIAKYIHSIDPSAKILILQKDRPDFLKSLIEFKPTATLSYPFLGLHAAPFYLAKLSSPGCRVLCLATEGGLSKVILDRPELALGNEHYHWSLVDRMLFWGHRSASLIGRELIKKSRIRSTGNIGVCGYPRLEAYFDPVEISSKDPDRLLPKRLVKSFEENKHRKKILILTSFILHEYTDDHMRAVGDVNLEEHGDYHRSARDAAIVVFEKYVNMIIDIATNYPDSLVVTKAHPLEIERARIYGKQVHSQFRHLENVLVVDEVVEVDQIIQYCDCLIHYGSTATVDAHLAGIPSIFASDNKYFNSTTPSTFNVPIADVPGMVMDAINDYVPSDMSEEVKDVLWSDFAVLPGCEYKPSRIVAEELLADTPAMRLHRDDPMLHQAMRRYGLNDALKSILE